MPLKNPSRFQKYLMGWYRTHARDLPWRRTKDPYKIWVSEIMLQQTQVDTVIPYYKKWLKRFPNLRSLAHAPLSEAMKYWAGLGYYRRARMMHETAQFLDKKNAGKIPATTAELLKLPGIGRYTAGAIASIAFDQKVPILDGNVIRVLTRLTALASDVGSPKTMDRLWKLSESLLPDKNPGDFNQAMMELGATVCWPDLPRCGICPVRSLCKANRLGRTTYFPVKKQRERIKKIRSTALILRNNEKVLIQKQPKDGRWGSLWMFPFWKNRQSMIRDAGIQSNSLKHRLTLHHGFTKYRVRLDVYEYNGVGKIKAGAWVPIEELSKFAFPSPHQKIVKELVKQHG